MAQQLKERDPLSSVLFQLQECVDAFDALREMNDLHQTLLRSTIRDDEMLPFSRHLIVTLLGMARDCFCIRLACLFDKRKDVHSLKKYFFGAEISSVETHVVTKTSIAARNGNIAHLGKRYVKWPEIDDILSSGLREVLQAIRIGIIFGPAQSRSSA